MRILYVAGREESYSRTRIVYKALLQYGFDIEGCFPPNKSFKHYPELIWRAVKQARGVDIIIVGFYGQLILPFVKLFTWKPILFDMYIATYDTMVHDRRMASPGGFKAWIYRQSDILACRLSQRMILETQDHIRDFAGKFHVNPDKFHRIFLAVDNEVIYPRNPRRFDDSFTVHFHGEYAPFHGVGTILQAADLLRDENIRFQLVGKGITYEQDVLFAREKGLSKVHFIDPVPYDDLALFMARADVCLGIFGDNDRMLRVLTNKVIESIGMAKPLITGKNAPVQELLVHGESVYLVERADPRALADAILFLRDHPEKRRKLAAGGYQVFQTHCTLEKFGNDFAKVLREMKNL